MALCNQIIPAGAAECLKGAGKLVGIIIDDLSVSFTDANFANLATNRAFLNETLKSYYLPLADYETGTADPTVLTQFNTRNIIADNPIPNATAFPDMSYCDRQELVKTLKGGTYRVRLVAEGNQVFAYRTDAGVIKGFKADVTALTKGVNQKADLDKNVTVYLNFHSYDEFEQSVVVIPDWNVPQMYKENTPVGLNMFTVTSYNTTTGVLVVQVNERCLDGFAGLVTADFEILSSSGLTSPAITATDNGLGSYDLLIQKEAVPEALDAGDSITFQVQNKTGSVVDYISNQFKLTAE